MPAAAYPTLIEPRWLELTITKIPLATAYPFRILQLTDFHASWAVPASLIESAVDWGLSTHPDLICLTGDFITHQTDFDSDRLIRTLQRLSAAHVTCAVLGNHDGGSWAKLHKGHSDHTLVERMLNQAGIDLLHNRMRTLDVGGKQISVAGVGDLWTGEMDPDRAFRGAQRKGPLVLLSHNPDSKEQLGRFEWDLMLCGHTHGRPGNHSVRGTAVCARE